MECCLYFLSFVRGSFVVKFSLSATEAARAASFPVPGVPPAPPRLLDIMQDDRFRGVPLCLETIDETIWPEEIQQLRQFAGEKQAAQ